MVHGGASYELAFVVLEGFGLTARAANEFP